MITVRVLSRKWSSIELWVNPGAADQSSTTAVIAAVQAVDLDLITLLPPVCADLLKSATA
jgi:hypothetical protein